MSKSTSRNYGILYWNLIVVLTTIPTNVYGNNLNNIWMKEISKELSEDFNIFKKDELGTEFFQQIYPSFKFAPSAVDANNTVLDIARSLEAKIEDIFSSLVRAKVAIQDMQNLDNETTARSSLIPCSENNANYSRVSRMCGNSLDMILKVEDHLHVDYVLQKLKPKIGSDKNWIKQLYYISSWEVESYPWSPFLGCHEIDNMLLWRNYIYRNDYKPRNIVLLLDIGVALSKHHLTIIKSLGKQVIKTLNERDKIALLAISNEWSTPRISDDCLMPNQVPDILLPAKAPIKKLFLKFIDGITKGSGATNHSLGLQQALNFVANSQKSNQVQNETVMVLYVSRGLLSSLTEARAVLETIARASKEISGPVVINTCAVIDESRPTIYEIQFLEDVALQNYAKFNITTIRKKSRHSPQQGSMLAINSTEGIGFAISHFFAYFNTHASFDVSKRISLPMWDYLSNDLTISMSVGTYANNQFGLLAIDIYFANWIEEIVYFNNKQKNLNQYAFLTDLEGRVILHPLFASPLISKQQLHYVDIANFENVSDFNVVRNKLLSQRSGSHKLTNSGSNIIYTWARTGNWYIVCIVTRDVHRVVPTRPYHIHQWPYNLSDPDGIKLVFQLLEDSDDSRLCRHLNQVATLDAGSLYLSPFCFQNPFSKLVKDPAALQNFTAYLQDTSGDLPNPGLRDEIKDEVAILTNALKFLRSQHLSSLKSKYIVRRYVASYGGVLQMFPGSILSAGLDPTKRPWFLQATKHKSRIVLIPPYLDEGGAGYIVTVAYATPHFVVAADFTYGYVFRMLLKRMPFCVSSNITCFLMDDRGYLIYHQNLIDPNGHGPVEKQHIVHKESLIANDILNNNLFIRKKMCNSYGDDTIQRYYKLNTSYSDVLINSVQGEHCVNYQIAAVPSTNIFVGMVNATCNVVVTFCPCSIVDRLCLNCKRMEQKECECPCECPLEQNCTVSTTNDSELCSWFPEHVTPPFGFESEADNAMEPCFPTTCNMEQSHYKCVGLTGCEWCKFDVDGTPLNNPFCASMTTCFNGIVGSLTPYKKSQQPELVPRSGDSFNVPISFICVFIMGVLLVVCMFYIYHRSTSPPVERLYLSSTQDNHLRMSDLNLSDNYHAVGHRDKLLQDDKPDHPISPYCVTSGYRRTALPESDHGYSTMTQHDESEHMSLAPVELDSLEDDLDDGLSIHKSVSLKPPPKPHVGRDSPPQFTQIAKSNKCIIVPVTVHRNMETT